MPFWNRLFGKKEKNDVELYMEERIRGHDTYPDTRKKEKKEENASLAETEVTKQEESLLQGDLSVIPEQYYFWKDDEMCLFMDYFQEGIFYANDCVIDRKRAGRLYAYFQNPEKILELWYREFLEEQKGAERNKTVKENIIYDIDELLRTVCAFGLQDCEKYILPIAKKRQFLDYWFSTEKMHYNSMLAFVEKLFFLGEEKLGVELLVKLFELKKEPFYQDLLQEDFMNIYCKMRRMIPKQVEQMRETLQQSVAEAGYKDFVQQLKQKDDEILENNYVNVYEIAEAFLENPEKTLEIWLELLREHEEEMQKELENGTLNKENSIGKQLTEYVLEAIGTIGKYRFAGIPKCLGENEEWCHFMIYSGGGENLNKYLNTMFQSNHVEIVERILKLLKPVIGKEKDHWNYFCTMLGEYSGQLFERWDMPENEEDFTQLADDFTDRWFVE